jgi:hypothetical protein
MSDQTDDFAHKKIGIFLALCLVIYYLYIHLA